MRVVDRTRWEIGFHCPRSRFLGFHLPVPGHAGGIVSRKVPIPLASGLTLHRVIELFLSGLSPEEACKRAVEAFQAETTLDLEIPGDPLPEDAAAIRTWHKYVVAEQSALVSGLFWVWLRYFWPWFEQNFEVLLIESESTIILGCTCGLGDLPDRETHEKRGCNGVCLMVRPDVAALRKSDNTAVGWDWKSTGYLNRRWRYNWENNVQFALLQLGLERRLHREIDATYVLGLLKGARKRERTDTDTDEPTGEYRQESPLCYAYYRKGNPPFVEEDWKFSYFYKDPLNTRSKTGQSSIKGKGYTKVPTWVALGPEPPWITGRKVVEMLPEDQGRQLMEVLGPIPKPRHLVDSLIRQLVHAEQTVWSLVDQVAGQADPQTILQDPQLDLLVPQSWNCERYGRPCQFLRVCRRLPGWQSPAVLMAEHYQPRVPHHDTELALVEAE